MTSRTRRGLWLCAVALVVLPALPAAAVLFCDTYCNCDRACTVKCWDNGMMTTCGAASYPCAGQCFAEDVRQSDATVPAHDAMPPADRSEACSVVPETEPVVFTQP